MVKTVRTKPFGNYDHLCRIRLLIDFSYRVLGLSLRLLLRFLDCVVVRAGVVEFGPALFAAAAFFGFSKKHLISLNPWSSVGGKRLCELKCPCGCVCVWVCVCVCALSKFTHIFAYILLIVRLPSRYTYKYTNTHTHTHTHTHTRTYIYSDFVGGRTGSAAAVPHKLRIVEAGFRLCARN